MHSALRRESELGRYELLCLLATGGMASVHLARAAGIGGFEKLLVIKRILPHAAKDRMFIQMFLDEARIAATLEHTNIAHVFDVGSSRGDVFLAMEFLHGHDVRSIARSVEGPVPLDPTIAIGVGVCAGLHYAHEKRGPTGQPLGLVHRDVSPSNVVVTYDGSVKLIDFGIAKATNRLGETRSGILKGKPGYMSPEQCLGEKVDRRSDVFCLGIVLYELTTGTRLFGPKEAEYLQLRAIVEGDVVPPSELIAGFSAELERIVLKALRTDPAERYQTALELQHALEAFAVGARLDVSPSKLAKFMERTFGDELEAWRSSERSGVTLAEHIVGVGQGRRPSARGMTTSDAATATESPAPRSGVNQYASTQLIAAEPSGPDAAHPGEVGRVNQTAGEATTRIPVSTTREGGSRPVVKRRRTRSQLTVLALVVLVLVTGAAGVALMRRPPPAPLTHAATPAPAPTPVTSLPLPKSSSREAVAAYAEAMQAMRDGAGATARVKLQHAVELDPMLAAAHLQLTLFQVGDEDQGARSSLQRARELRAYLTERDQEFLEALEPMISRTQANAAEATSRFLALSQRYPGDAEIAHELSIAQFLKGDIEGSVASARRALALDPDFLLVLGVLGDEQAYLGDFDAGLKTLDRCVAASGAATSCAVMSGEIRAQLGQCEAAATTNRSVRAATPGSFGYTLAVEAAVARGDPPPVIRELLDRQSETVPWKRARMASRQAALEGDFVAAEAAAREMQTVLAHEPSTEPHMFAAIQLSEIYAETGRKAEAGKAAQATLQAADAWEPEARVDDDGIGRDRTPRLFVDEYRAGLLSKEELVAKRTAWLTAWEAKAPPFYRGYLWVQAYSETAETTEDAREALGVLPRYGAIPPLRTVNALSVGRVYWLAGDLDRAVPALESEAHACTAYRWPFEHVRARYMLGRALEAKGETRLACAEYQAVLAQWGHAKPRSMTAENAKAHAQAISCDFAAPTARPR